MPSASTGRERIRSRTVQARHKPDPLILQCADKPVQVIGRNEDIAVIDHERGILSLPRQVDERSYLGVGSFSSDLDQSYVAVWEFRLKAIDERNGGIGYFPNAEEDLESRVLEVRVADNRRPEVVVGPTNRLQDGDSRS